MKLISLGPLTRWEIFLFLLCPALALGQAADNGASAPEPVEYTVEDIQGSGVLVLENGSSQWTAAQEGEVLESGDEIKADGGSQAVLMLQSDTSVNLNPGSDLKVDQIADNQRGGFLSRLELLGGQVLADVKKNLGDSQSTFEVSAGGVICGVRGTAFEVDNQDGQVETLTHEGSVDVQSGGQDNLVQAGNAFSFRHGRFFGRRLLRQEEVSRFQRWRERRPMIFEKRRHRLEQIRRGLRRPWVRRAIRRRMRHRFGR